jgi:DNA/RNA-binding domain of Phe-tRNA-synthetase-like protein
MKITIDQKLKDITPDFFVGILSFDIINQNVEDESKIIRFWEDQIHQTIDIKDVVQLETIIDGRNAYKAYGKDPSRYRLAVESLYRRLAKGNKLYRVNQIVDLGNVLSIMTRKSVAVLDYDKIQGDILIRLGVKEDEYYGIGRGKLNIENIPLYEDDISPFGSVTSDTERTMITSETTKILLFIISFSGKEILNKDLKEATDLYSSYLSITNIDSYMI